MDAIVQADGVKKAFHCRDGNPERNEKQVLRGVNLSVYPGEYISIMGRSGSGKSTLLNILGLLIPPSEGTLFFEGKKVEDLWKDELANIRRRRVGFIFQNFELIESISALNNIMIAGFLEKKSKEEVYERTVELTQSLDLSQDLLKKYPSELSGGEKQRVAIVRALINNPDLILADEPTSALDAENRDHLLTLLQKTYYSAGILFVSHDVFALKMLCKDTAILEQGTIIERQNTEALFTYPQQEWTQAFVRAAETRKGEDWSWKAL